MKRLLLSVLFMANLGCRPPTTEDYIRMTDAKPADQRPPDWENTKRYMARKAPAVGDAAPDFTLTSLDGKQSITRSRLHEGRPLVLLFGSFT